MSFVKQMGRLAPAVRNLSTSPAISSAKKMEIAEGFKQLKTLQAKYQHHDGLPVHLKRGTTDVILYRGTMAASLFAFCWIMKLFYELV